MKKTESKKTESKKAETKKTETKKPTVGTKRPPSGAKPFKKTSLNEKVFCVFLVLIYSIPSISIEF